MSLIEEVRLHGLLEKIEGVVRGDGFREEYILSSETPESCMSGAITEIFYNVGGFDDWFFDPEDIRTIRVHAETVSSNNEPLVQAVREVVTYNLEELEEERDTEDIVTKLVGYIVTWQDWYYDYKILQDRSHWYENMGINREIYEIEGDYGVEDSMGLSNMYEGEAPWSGLDIEAIEERVFMGPTTLSDEVITKSEPEPTGDIVLSPQVTEFHLPGQHDQSAHGKGGSKIPSRKIIGPQSPEDAALILRVTTATQVKKLTGGRSGASVEIVKSPSGKAVRKSKITREVADKEYLVSIVGRALGAPVPRVARVDSHTLVSDFVEGSPAGTFKKDIGRFIPKDRAARERTVHLKGARELGMLDIATANADRHGGNAMISRDGKSVVGIDHGTVFGGKAVYGIRPAKVFEKEWRGSFTKRDYDGALTKVKGVEGDFRRLGRGEWYDGMVERLETGASSSLSGGTITLSEMGGTIHLVSIPSITDFHLPGQHDQGSHGGKGGSSSPEDTALLKKVATATDRKSLAGGRSGAGVEILKGPMGKAVIKSGLTKDDMDAEVLASKVGRALGATVPTVVRMPGGKAGAYQVAIDYTPGKMAGTFGRDIGRVLPRDNDARSRVRSLKGARELGMMDIAIRNADRHGGNIMVRPGGKSIAGIDHAKSFRVHRVLHEAKPLADKWKKDFSRGDFEGALERVRPLRGEFTSRNQTEWFDNMVGRLEKGVEKAEMGSTGTINLSPQVTDFHLPGQHDQGSHGGMSGGSKYASSPEEKALLDRETTALTRKELTGGRSGARLELLKGPQGKAVLKGGIMKEDADKEYLSSKVGRALGANVPLVARKGPNTIVLEYVTGDVAGGFLRDIGRVINTDDGARKKVHSLQGARELALLDIAIGNKDRHGGNIMIRQGGKSIVGIDHITSFGSKAFLRVRPSKALERHWKGSFTEGDYRGAIQKIQETKGDFIRLGRGDWFNGMEERLGKGFESTLGGNTITLSEEYITLSEPGVLEFHLPGQHDQGSHGRGGGSEAILLRKLDTATFRKTFTAGSSGAKVELLNGPEGKAVFKSNVPDPSEVDKEYLVSKVAKAFGAPTPGIARVQNPKTGVYDSMVQEYVEGDTVGMYMRGTRGRLGDKLGRPVDEGTRMRVASLKGARELSMLDFAVRNIDRHSGNIMVSPDGKSITGIDHAFAFTEGPVILRSWALEKTWKKTFEKEDYQEAKRAIAPLKKDFEDLGRGEWWDTMNDRLDRHV